MPEFKDATGQNWTVELDGLLLADLREKCGVDIVQEGIYAVEEREDVLVKSLLVLCREQIDARKLTDRQFARLIVGPITALALDAVRGAAELFFRPSRWSEIQSRSDARKEADANYRTLQPMLAILNRPDMPEAMRDAVMAAITSKIEAAGATDTSDQSASASGLDLSRLNVAGVSLDLSAYPPVA